MDLNFRNVDKEFVLQLKREALEAGMTLKAYCLMKMASRSIKKTSEPERIYAPLED
jgi:hypothetical protein